MKPIIIEDVQPDIDEHVDGREAGPELEREIRDGLSGRCDVAVTSAYHDFVSGVCTTIWPDRVRCDAVLRAIRRVLPKWHYVTVSLQTENHLILFTAYAHNLISSGRGDALPGKAIVALQTAGGAR